ncbi:MAG: efflux RND transporter periplasmic adaptor subunit [Labedaea sp.]
MKRSRRVLAINGVLVLVLGAAAWGAYVLLWPSEQSNAASGVRTTQVLRTNVVETVSAAGTVQSAYTANADFGTSGTVTEIDVKVGDVVAVGQQLAKLDPTQASQQVTAAQSSLSAAKEDLANAQDAAATPTTSPNGQQQSANAPTVTSLQAKVDQAKVTLQQAKDALAATVLKAPGAGTVTAINGSVGQRAGSSNGSGSATGQSTGQSTGTAGNSSASSSSSFIVLTNMTNLVVKANVAEIDVSKIKAGQDATVTINAMPDTPVAAKVGATDLTPTTSNNIVQFGVSLNLTQPPAGLRPGQSASVSMVVARADDTLAVPSAAVRTVGGQNSVTVLSGGQQSARAVEVGVRSEALVQITSGLSETDEVVLSTASATTNGTGGFGGFGGGGGGNGGRQGGGAGGFGGGGGGAVVPGTGR